MTDTTLVQRHPLEAYADSYAQMSRTGYVTVDCRSVEADIRQNMIPVTVAADEITRLTEANKALTAERDEAKRRIFPYADATEICGYSTTGIYLIGDRKSIKAAEKAFHYSAQIEEYRTAFNERVSAAEAKLAKVEAERAEQWSLRREAEGSREAVQAACDTMRDEQNSDALAAEAELSLVKKDRDRLSAELAEARRVIEPFAAYAKDPALFPVGSDYIAASDFLASKGE